MEIPVRTGRSGRSGHAVVVLVLALGLNVACTDQPAPQPQPGAQPASAATGMPAVSPMGVVPAGPTKEAPATTSVVKSEVSKADQSSAMPMPGQANDHSTLAPPAAKKSATPAR